jgi:hypothetical protein
MLESKHSLPTIILSLTFSLDPVLDIAYLSEHSRQNSNLYL